MPLITADEVDQGYKDVPCETRDGRSLVIRLRPVPARQAQALLARMMAEKDDCVPLLASLSSSDPADSLDRLALESITHLKAVAFALNFGETFQKKILEAARILAHRTNTISVAPSSASSEPATAPTPSNNGASPS